MQLDQLGHELARLEVDRFELQPAGLDTGEVEQVVEHAQQAARGGARRLGQVALLLVRCALVQQVQADDHAVHRGADFVADVGQEVRLGLARRLRRVARVRQAFDQLRQFAVLPLQVHDHLVEAALELTDLVAARHRDVVRQIARRDRSGQLAQRDQRCDDALPDIADEQTDRDGEDDDARQHQRQGAAAVIQQRLLVLKPLGSMVSDDFHPQRVRLALVGVDAAEHGSGVRGAAHRRHGGRMLERVLRELQDSLLQFQEPNMVLVARFWRAVDRESTQHRRGHPRLFHRLGGLGQVVFVAGQCVTCGLAGGPRQCGVQLAIEQGAPIVAHDIGRRAAPLDQLMPHQGVAAGEHEQRAERRGENLPAKAIHRAPGLRRIASPRGRRRAHAANRRRAACTWRRDASAFAATHRRTPHNAAP